MWTATPGTLPVKNDGTALLIAPPPSPPSLCVYGPPTPSPSTEIDTLYCRRVEVRDNFRRQQEVYMEATEEMREAEKQEREEEARQRRAERESRRRRQ